jgi:hypothetical protein
MTYNDIRPIQRPVYEVDISWDYLEDWLARQDEYFGLDLEPPFQRGHVWTLAQRSKYIEWILRGGWSGKDIFWNCPGWNDGKPTHKIQCVDGLQRVTSVRMYLRDEVPAFGQICSQFGKIPCLHYNFRFHVAALKNQHEVLQWYIDLNDGGVVHTEEEIERVKQMLEQYPR